MVAIEVKELPGDDRADYVFKVGLSGGHRYTVLLAEDYYQKLTGGKSAKEELVEKSFEFLLEREAPESILSEFGLPLIQKYFPEYETRIKQMLAGNS